MFRVHFYYLLVVYVSLIEIIFVGIISTSHRLQSIVKTLFPCHHWKLLQQCVFCVLSILFQPLLCVASTNVGRNFSTFLEKWMV